MAQCGIGRIIETLGKGGQLGRQVRVGEIAVDGTAGQLGRRPAVRQKRARQVAADGHKRQAPGHERCGKRRVGCDQCPADAGASADPGADNANWRPQ